MFARDVKKEGVHIGKQEYILASPLKPMGMDGVEHCAVHAPFAAAGGFRVYTAGHDAGADRAAAACGICRPGQCGGVHGDSRDAQHGVFWLLGRGAFHGAARADSGCFELYG